MTNNNSGRNLIRTKYGKIEKVEEFKYLGEMITANGLDKIAIGFRANRMFQALAGTGQIYNKKSLSWNSKFRHYNTVIKPQALYAAETLTLGKGKLEDVGTNERKILRRIMGPTRNSQGQYRMRSNKDIYQENEPIDQTIRKKRLKYFGHVWRMEGNRNIRKLLNKLFELKTTVTWVKEVKEDLERAGISIGEVSNREIFRRKVAKGCFQVEGTIRPGAKWTEERKQRFSERMKISWQRRRAVRNRNVLPTNLQIDDESSP